jgi:hypothetical protein
MGKKSISRLGVCLWLLCVVAGPQAQVSNSLFPSSDSTLLLRRDDSVKTFSGRALFTYINGGAEIFMENGFNSVATATYTVDNTERIQTEVYDMKDSAAAYSTYTSYINPDAKSVAVGTDAIFLKYFLVFWKAHYVVVLSTVSSTDATKDRLMRLSTAIAGRILKSQSRPPIARLFLDSLTNPAQLRYLKGRVGLSNFHVFSPSNAFVFNEAVAFTANNYEALITIHPNDKEAVAALLSAKTKIAQEDTTLRIVGSNVSFSYADFRQAKINCFNFKRFNMVVITQGATADVEKVKSRIVGILEQAPNRN